MNSASDGVIVRFEAGWKRIRGRVAIVVFVVALVMMSVVVVVMTMVVGVGVNTIRIWREWWLLIGMVRVMLFVGKVVVVVNALLWMLNRLSRFDLEHPKLFGRHGRLWRDRRGRSCSSYWLDLHGGRSFFFFSLAFLSSSSTSRTARFNSVLGLHVFRKRVRACK